MTHTSPDPPGAWAYDDEPYEAPVSLWDIVSFPFVLAFMLMSPEDRTEALLLTLSAIVCAALGGLVTLGTGWTLWATIPVGALVGYILKLIDLRRRP